MYVMGKLQYEKACAHSRSVHASDASGSCCWAIAQLESVHVRFWGQLNNSLGADRRRQLELELELEVWTARRRFLDVGTET